MPVIKNSSYKPPAYFANGHIQTIYPALFRKIKNDFYMRERIQTPDDDFLDLDWSKAESDKLAIISHGLEGSTDRAYVTGMVKALNKNGWDALAWNFRSCSGEVNRRLRWYHNGATDDLDTVVQHVIQNSSYVEIALIGFSMGGNLSLVFLGEKGEKVSSLIKKAVVFSVPCDIKASAAELAKFKNKIYMKRFLGMLRTKIKAKMKLLPGEIDDIGYRRIQNFKDFDDRYTAPIHGFKDAEDYWKKCSSARFIYSIRIPTLLVNAKDDPFLGPGCFPFTKAEASEYVFLEGPDSGGHVGFMDFSSSEYWSEQRAVEFLNQN